LADCIMQVEARQAEAAEIALVHNPRYIEAMRRLCAAGGQYMPQMEATVGPASWDAALRAAGAGLTLADLIMQSAKCEMWSKEYEKNLNSKFKIPNPKLGFAPTRPPGHHALTDRPMGFCIFNNIAILAKYLQIRYNLARLAIIDFDVHHGNGTEAVFWGDPSVFYVSLHRDNLFPYNKGRGDDCGAGAGVGFTLNIPLPAGVGDDIYLKAFDTQVVPRVNDFAPQFMLVSAGFDAHISDPLGGMRLTTGGFRAIGERIRQMAEHSAEGRIISLLEGGYHLDGLRRAIMAYLGALI